MNEQTIFATALAKKNPQERQAFLAEACGIDAELRAQVEELLAAGEGASSFLEHPPAGVDVTIDASLSKDTVNSAVTGSSLPFLQPCDKRGRIGILGTYEIIEVVGQGGMGSVLRAVDTKLSRIVAVKVMAPELAANPTAVKRFLREAQSAAAVVHDHVVHIYGVYDESRPPYLVMEFIAGQTLQQKIDKEGALQLKHILRIGSQMAAGLAAAHKTGLIHRDVKPGNILLENGVERVKITDFGLARAADDVEMTKTGMIAGTPQYMSPEQARGEQIDTRSDLFSLGSVLYAMCTGRPPFRSETTMGTLRRVCEDTPRPIREVNPEIPEWLNATIDKLLAKRPDDRFQTAAEVSDLLSQFLAHLQQPGTMPLPAIPVMPVVATPVAPFKPPYDSPSQSNSGIGVILMVCLAVLALPILGLVVLFAGWFMFSSTTIEPGKPSISYSGSASTTAHAEESLSAAAASSLAVAPFDSPQAKTYQEASARQLDVDVEFTNSLGMKLRLIPPGEFQMGETQEAVDRLVQSLEQGGAGEYDKFVAKMSSPQHKVRITQPFYCGAHEVTVGQYRKFIEKTKYVGTMEQLGVKDRFAWTSSAVEPNADERAVIGVSWDDAKAFCKWLSKEEGRTYELPTEAQWEYACRAGTTTAWSFGDEAAGLADHAIHGRKSFWPAEVVGTKAANPFGLFDMHGNADEWCLDWHLRDFYAKSPTDDPVCLTDPKDKTSGRVARGGASISAPWWTRSTTRAYDFPSTPKNPKGFRVVLLRPESVGWKQLFNGQDLTGWKVHPFHQNKWKVEDGILVGTGGYSNLFTERDDFENFELRVEAKVSGSGNSGVMIRSEYGFDFDLTTVGGAGKLPRGMEVDIHPGIQPEHAGSIWHLGEPHWMAKATQQLIKPDQWFTLHVLAKGKELQVKIDDVTVVNELKNKVGYDTGHITLLQQMGVAGQVWFRKIEIKELPQSRAAKEIAGWGQFFDPQGDCRAETKNGKLTLTAPGSRVHDLNPRTAFNSNLDAPRVLREIEGDFQMQVRVEPVPPPLAKTAGHGGASFQGAGLLLWISEKKFVRLERAGMGETNAGYPYIHAEWFDAGQVVEAQQLACLTGPTFLQVERRGQKLLLRYGADGKTWTDAKSVAFELPDSLRIGPVNVNCTTKDFAVSFADFQVTTEPEYTLKRFDAAKTEALKKDAVLHFSFEKDSFFEKDGKTFVRDLSGQSNDGECRDVFPDPVGKAGGSLRNDGGGFVQLLRPLIANKPAYTVAGWMKLKEPRIKKPAIFYNCASKKDPRHNPAFHVLLNVGGQMFCAVWHETRDWTDVTTTSSQFDRNHQEWVFLAARYEEEEKGGTLQVTLGNQTLTRPSHMLKNSDPSNSTDYLGLDLVGWIDEVSLWPRKLTDEELHYVQMLGKAGRSLATFDTASPEPARAPPR